MIKIIIPKFRPPTWNAIYQSKHWSTRAKLVQMVHGEVAFASRGILPLPLGSLHDVHIDVYFKNRPYDSDNVPIKVFVDGLKGRILKDDTISYIRRVSSESHIDKLNPRVVITLTSIE